MRQRVQVLAGAAVVLTALWWQSSFVQSEPRGVPEAVQAQPPEATIANGQIRARLYLPDPQRGFYRSTRFDWSGVIGSLEYQGHQYYGPWFTKSDPSVRDFIYKGPDIIVSAQSGVVGPAEEFPRPQGYTTAKPGETFVKIGVGVLRKRDDSDYSAYNTYEIVDPGKWTAEPHKDRVDFVQEVNDPKSGFGYVYRKSVALAGGRPELVIDHSLRNIGKLPIQATQYNHNFLVLDGATTGPEFSISFPFQVQTSKPPDPKLAAIKGNQILYLKTLEGEERVSFGIQGFAKDSKDYDIRIDNRKSGAGFRVTSDRPPASIALWSIRSVISIEPFVDVSTEPGSTTNWKYIYSYYVAKK